MGEYAIEASHLTKTYKLYESSKRRIIEGLFPKAKPQYRQFHALHDVSFQIKKGEIVGIIGKNGSGKSTLLKLITGVLNPSNGSVAVDGRLSALLELGAGFNPEYTGIENIYLNGTLNKITREEMAGRIADIADFADIGDFIEQPVKNYSSGMFVRLAFAAAVYSDPDILIVDEALAVGDAAFQAKCMARMNQIMKSGAAVLFVTHDMNTVKRLCQRCIYLENGKKIMEGPAEELADIYLRRIRAVMNEEHLKLEKGQEDLDQKNGGENRDMDSGGRNDGSVEERAGSAVMEPEDAAERELINRAFVKRTERFKEGTGEAEFIDLRLLDGEGREKTAFAYNEVMKIQATMILKADREFAMAYHIRDDKNTELIGSSTLRETKELIRGKKGDIYRFEFVTRLPLIEGNYNMTLLASVPVIKNRSALFLDFIENAAVFSVEENFENKLWDKVYLKNDVVIKKINLPADIV